MRDSARQTKSDKTRAAILAAAQALFAARGYERTTVRDIAAGAGIDASMVIRYFGSKNELFARVAEPDLRLPDLGKIEPAQIGETLVRHFLSVWEDESGLAILLRSAASNEQAAGKLREIFKAQVVPALARAGGKAGAAERAGLVATQMLGLALCRYVLKLPPVVDMSRAVIVKKIGKTLQRYATGED